MGFLNPQGNDLWEQELMSYDLFRNSWFSCLYSRILAQEPKQDKNDTFLGDSVFLSCLRNSRGNGFVLATAAG